MNRMAMDNVCAVAGCGEQPFIRHPLPLCRQDALTVSLNVTDILHANATLQRPAPGECDVEKAFMPDGEVWGQPSHPPIVYFLANGDRVKIGTSTNISARVAALSLRRSNAALLLRGGTALESALHMHFAADRLAGTEWFAFSQRIQEYVARRIKVETALQQPVLAEDTEAAAKLAQYRQPVATSAQDRILQALKPSVAEHPIAYLRKDRLSALTGLNDSTLSNALTRLIKDGRIHRRFEAGRTIPGTYGIGPFPQASASEPH